MQLLKGESDTMLRLTLEQLRALSVVKLDRSHARVSIQLSHCCNSPASDCEPRLPLPFPPQSGVLAIRYVLCLDLVLRPNIH